MKIKNALQKRGISLIILIITIIVSLILIATVTIATGDAIDNANLTTFSKDLTEIQDATEAYYITNNTMPIIDGSVSLGNADLIALSTDQDLMTSEINENGDVDAKFYEIDLAKINVTKAVYGYQKLDANDVFFVSYPNFNAYYPYGVNAKGTKYFSITSRLSAITKIPQTQVDTSVTTTTSSGGIVITKINGWTNKMGVNISVDIASDESLYMSVSGGPNRLITTTVGKNSFGFNLLSSIVNDLETIKVPFLTMEEANYIEQGTKPITERYVDIIKYKGTDIIGRSRIDLSNFSLVLPTITNATITSYQAMNTTVLTLGNSESGISQVRYEYLTKYTENGTIDNYYSGVTDFDSTYMQSEAKTAAVTNNLTVSINTPKNVQSIKVAVIDKAGNINLYNQIVAPSLYIGYTLDSNTPSSLQLTARMYSVNGIRTISFAISTDSVNFTNEQVYTLNTTNNGTTVQQCAPFTNLTANTIYIRLIAVNSDNTITETRVEQINLAGSITYLGNKPTLAPGMTALSWNGTNWVAVANPDTDTTWYDYSAGKWANAQTADGSMWVWIPRYIYKIGSLWHASSGGGGALSIQFTKGTNDNWNSSSIGLISTQVSSSASNNLWTNEPAFTFGTTELTGIWVAKFEASGALGAVDVKPGVSSLRNITINTMFNECRGMETNTRYGWGTSGIGFDTHLMKNVEWGALAYLSQSLYGKNGVEIAQNTDSAYTTGGGATNAYITNVNQSTTGNVYGVYDMSGGAWEYTAAYTNNGNANLTTNGSSILGANAMYSDIYTVTTDTASQNYANAVNKKGDAVFETSNPTGNVTSWFNDYLGTPYTATPFFMRGGIYSGGAETGIYAFFANSGAGYPGISFRPVIAVDNTL